MLTRSTVGIMCRPGLGSVGTVSHSHWAYSMRKSRQPQTLTVPSDQARHICRGALSRFLPAASVAIRTPRFVPWHTPRLGVPVVLSETGRTISPAVRRVRASWKENVIIATMLLSRPYGSTFFLVRQGYAEQPFPDNCLGRRVDHRS